MNYLQIEAFLKTVELGSMTKAAQALFISQSTLSDRINKLEEELDTQLFSRGHGSRGVSLTKKGQGFLDYAIKYLSIIDDINDWKNEDSTRVEINIGAPHSINGFFLKEFYKKYADVSKAKLNISSHWNHNIYTMLDTFKLDLGIVSRPYGSKHIRTEKFFKEPLYIVQPRLRRLFDYQRRRPAPKIKRNPPGLGPRLRNMVPAVLVPIYNPQDNRRLTRISK